MNETDRVRVGAIFGANPSSTEPDISVLERGLREPRLEILLKRGGRIPRIDTLVRLAGALDARPERLLQGMKWSPTECPPGRFE